MEKIGDIGNLFLGSLGNLLVNLGKIAIQVAVGIKAIKMGLVAYGLHYPTYYIIKNTINLLFASENLST